MTKSVISHEENNFHLKHLSVIKAQEAILGSYKPRMLDPKIQPFFEDWKSQKNIQINAIKPAAKLDFAGNSDIIKNNEKLLPEVPSFYLDEEYVELCKKYHIPYKAVYHSYRELDATEESVAEYADLLKDAKSLGIYWDTSIFDMEGLQEAIEEYHSEEADHDYFTGLSSDRWDYYSRLGV